MTWLWITAALILIVAAAGGWFWYNMGQPLYQPGMVRAGKNLTAPLTPPPRAMTQPFGKSNRPFRYITLPSVRAVMC